MAYEYQITVEPVTAQYHSYLREKGWSEIWRILVVHIDGSGPRHRDVAIPPKGWVAPEGYDRSVYYLAPSKKEAQVKAEQIARDHAAKLKAAEQAPLKYKFMVP